MPVPTHPMGRFPWDSHRNEIPMDKLGNTVHTRENTFSTIKQGNVKIEIEWQGEHWTIVSDLLQLTLVLIKERSCQRSLDHRHHTDRDL